jgi:hypothetical protein
MKTNKEEKRKRGDYSHFLVGVLVYTPIRSPHMQKKSTQNEHSEPDLRCEYQRVLHFHTDKTCFRRIGESRKIWHGSRQETAYLA